MGRDKYRQLFLDEARENLSAYAKELVAFEKLQDEEGEEAKSRRTEAMDAVFRAAHSLKGMAASMGYDAFARLAHSLEDLADLARKGGRLSPAAMDLLLEGGDRLEAMLEKIAGGRPDADDPSDIASRIAALLEPDGEEPVKAAPQASAFAPDKAAPSGGGVMLEVTFREDAPLPQVRAFMLHRTLSGLKGY